MESIASPDHARCRPKLKHEGFSFAVGSSSPDQTVVLLETPIFDVLPEKAGELEGFAAPVQPYTSSKEGYRV